MLLKSFVNEFVHTEHCFPVLRIDLVQFIDAFLPVIHMFSVCSIIFMFVYADSGSTDSSILALLFHSENVTVAHNGSVMLTCIFENRFVIF